MASPRKPRRWSWTTGEKGKNRVRVYDRGSRGIFLDTFVHDPLTSTATRKRISLGRVDRETAKRKAEELAGKLRINGRSEAPQLTVGTLFDSYEAQVTPTKGTNTGKHDKRALEMMRRHGGSESVSGPNSGRRASGRSFGSWRGATPERLHARHRRSGLARGLSRARCTTWRALSGSERP